MVANQILQSTIDDLSAITKTELSIMDLDGTTVAFTPGMDNISPLTTRSFIDSQAAYQVVNDNHLFKILDEGETVYVLAARGTTENTNMIGRIGVSQVQGLLKAYKERFDKNNFFQNLILDNLLLVDIYNRAKKLHVSVEARRVVFLIETKTEQNAIAMETLKGLYTNKQGDYVTAVDERNLILVKEVAQDEGYEEMDQVARTLVDMLNAEAMVTVRVSYGTIIKDLKEVSKSYKEAQMAMDVGKIFYEEKTVVAYNTLGIGRLIYQLPINLCEVFMKEIFGNNVPDDLDEETLSTINKFFENNLNVSETSRQLYVHRNTLVYRLEKLQKSTGLDIRTFDDALTFKIALMVVNYMKYIREQEY